MQHIDRTLKCYTKNKLHSDYYKKVTTSRTAFLPFSLMQLIVTHLMERKSHTDPAITELIWNLLDVSQNSTS